MQISSICFCEYFESHTFTNFNFNGENNEKFFERTIFIRNTIIPKTYAVSFKHVSNTFNGLISNATIHSNAQVVFFVALSTNMFMSHFQKKKILISKFQQRISSSVSLRNIVRHFECDMFFFYLDNW